MARPHIIHIRADDEELEAARLVAEARGKTLSELGRDLIKDAFYACLDEQLMLTKLQQGKGSEIL